MGSPTFKASLHVTHDRQVIQIRTFNTHSLYISVVDYVIV